MSSSKYFVIFFSLSNTDILASLSPTLKDTSEPISKLSGISPLITLPFFGKGSGSAGSPNK